MKHLITASLSKQIKERNRKKAIKKWKEKLNIAKTKFCHAYKIKSNNESIFTMIWVGLIMNKWACFGGEGPHAQNDGGLPFLFFPQVHQVEGWCNAIHHHGDHRSLPTLFRFTQFVLAISGCYADFACRHVRNWKEEVRNQSRLKEQGGSWAVWQGGGEAAGEKGCFLKCFGFYQKKKKNLKKTPKKKQRNQPLCF